MIRAALLALLARASAAHNRALLAAAASCPGDGEDLVVGSDDLMAVAEAVGVVADLDPETHTYVVAELAAERVAEYGDCDIDEWDCEVRTWQRLGAVRERWGL